MQGIVDRSGFNQCIQMNVGKLLLQETGTYNPQYSRPYEIHADGADIENIVNRVAAQGDGNVTGRLLAGAAGHILAPTAAPGNEIVIPCGWNEKRVRFMLEIHCQYTFSNMIYYIQGYTNYVGMTQANIAPDMVFTINSILGVTRTQRQTPTGIQTLDIPKESFQVIGPTQQQNDRSFLMRPHDVFTGMHTEYIRNIQGLDQYHTMIDNRAQIRQDSQRSSRMYGLPSNYVANLVDKYTHATMMLEYGQNNQDALSTARNDSLDSPLLENPFIRAISRVKGFGSPNTFTFADLVRIDPNTDNMTTIMVVPTAMQMNVHHTGQSEYWHGGNRITQVATTLSQSVPAIMMELMISKMRFRVTNHDIGGVVNFTPMDFRGLSNMDMTTNVMRFRERLINEVLFDVSFGNQEPYMIDMDIDMFGDTSIDINMYGTQTRFVTPSFCDNLTVPIVTNNEMCFNSLVHGVDTLVNQVAGELVTNNKIAQKPIRV